MSGLFHAIDTLDLFPQYRLHTPAEVLKRNHVSRWEVLRDVVIQQVIQTGVGIALTVLDKEAMGGKEEWDVAWWAQWVRRAQWGIPGVLSLVGLDAKGMSSGNSIFSGALAGGVYPELTQIVLQHGQEVVAPAFADWEIQAAKAIYHLGVPAIQFAVAILIVDTWQYFLHRAMHMN
ncbi:Sphingolipid C4-hydroxylase sur2, partial [Oleoguttula sp. CCFEE 5521]